MALKSNLIGRKYGKLTVIAETHHRNHGCVVWKCKCDCGRIKIASTLHLNGNKVKCCGKRSCRPEHSHNFIDRTGMIFGDLIVVEEVKKPGKSEAYWKCLCKCGKERIVPSSELRSGNIVSCGKGICKLKYKPGMRVGPYVLIDYIKPKMWWKCLCTKCNREVIRNISNAYSRQSCGCVYHRGENKGKVRKALNLTDKKLYRKFQAYVTVSKNKNREFNLTAEQFESLVKDKCYYCGDYGKPYNGIDRVNSKLGYTIRNTVSCCSKCNYAKSDMKQKEFEEHILKIATHVKKRHKSRIRR